MCESRPLQNVSDRRNCTAKVLTAGDIVGSDGSKGERTTRRVFVRQFVKQDTALPSILVLGGNLQSAPSDAQFKGGEQIVLAAPQIS